MTPYQSDIFGVGKGLDGARVKKILDMWHLSLSTRTLSLKIKNALVLGGIRIGSPAMTTRGLSKKDFVAVADFIKEGVEIITKEAKKVVLRSKLQDFTELVTSPEFPLKERVEILKNRVESFTSRFPILGV